MNPTDTIANTVIWEAANEAWNKGDMATWRRNITELYNGRFGGSDRVIAEEVVEFVNSTEEPFNSTEVYNSLQLPTDQGARNRMRKAALAKLNRMKDDGILESLGYGRYRKIMNTKEVMDWWSADLEEIPIKLPMGLSDHHCIYPDNMIGIAGVSNYGKTAFMHRTIRDNIDNRDLWDFYGKSYQKEPLFEVFDTDTGPQEMHRRIKNVMDGDIEKWRTCVTTYPRNSEFKDVINPHMITFIDYLRLGDNFYTIGNILEGLYEKLRGNKGICFYGLQKTPNKEVGLGGWFGVHKARLYISIDMGRMSVVKAKNPREGENITNWYCEFDLRDGHTFEVTRALKPEMLDAMTGVRVR